MRRAEDLVGSKYCFTRRDLVGSSTDGNVNVFRFTELGTNHIFTLLL